MGLVLSASSLCKAQTPTKDTSKIVYAAWRVKTVIKPQPFASDRIDKERSRLSSQGVPESQIKQILANLQNDSDMANKGTVQVSKIILLSNSKITSCDLYDLPSVSIDTAPTLDVPNDPKLHSLDYYDEKVALFVTDTPSPGTPTAKLDSYDTEPLKHIDYIPGIRTLLLDEPIERIYKKYPTVVTSSNKEIYALVDRKRELSNEEKKQFGLALNQTATSDHGKVRITVDATSGLIKRIDCLSPKNPEHVRTSLQPIGYKKFAEGITLPLQIVQTEYGAKTTPDVIKTYDLLSSHPGSEQDQKKLITPLLRQTEVTDYRLGHPPITYMREGSIPDIETVRPVQKKRAKLDAELAKKEQQEKLAQAFRLITSIGITLFLVSVIVVLRRRWKI